MGGWFNTPYLDSVLAKPQRAARFSPQLCDRLGESMATTQNQENIIYRTLLVGKIKIQSPQ